MEIRIGLRNTPRELSFESKQSPAEIEKSVETALSSDQKQLKLVDEKGRIFIVPLDALAYIEIGAEEARRVGFIA